MHTCPFCGQECDCDLDDTGGLPVPDDCPHVCADPDNDDWEDEELGQEDIWEDAPEFIGKPENEDDVMTIYHQDGTTTEVKHPFRALQALGGKNTEDKTHAD
jgi:hypothetical protein